MECSVLSCRRVAVEAPAPMLRACDPPRMRYAVPLRYFTLALIIAALHSISTQPARAGCHLIDCLENVDIKPADLKGHSCEQLWILRNSVFHEQGYCFHSDKARKWFVGKDCKFDDIRLVPLNDYQRKNVEVVQAAEKDKGCVGSD